MSLPHNQSPLRPILFVGIASIVFLLLSWRLVSLQIINGVEFRDRSDNNRFRLIEVTAPRGAFLDINGKLLVTSTVSYSCYGVPNELWRDERSTQLLNSIFEYAEQDIRQDIVRPYRSSFRPVRLCRDLSFSQLSAFEEQRDLIPGAFLEIEPKRYHPDKLCPHIIGYIGEISERELPDYPELKSGDLIGKRGLEKLYDDQLRGRKGKRFAVVNVHGQEVRSADKFEEIQPIPGNEVRLTINRGAQMLAESLLIGEIGAIVVMDIATGGVRAAASSPSYDPDIFAGTLQSKDWDALLADENKPMLNRTVETMYPPGSATKMALLIEGLMSGAITPSFTAHCPGSYTVGNHTFKCWKKGGHGTIDCIGAIEASCDVFFYTLGMKLGADGIHRAYARFHFGQKTGIDVTAEAAGLVPSTEYYDRRYGKNGWTKGYIPSISIGQGEVLVTPIQLCAFAAAMGDGKVWRQPYLVESIRNPLTGVVIQPERAAPIELNVSPEIMSIAKEGMRRVVWGERGTARAQQNKDVPIAGKTGTAQNAHGDDHAWFVGYAPEPFPRYAACALVEFGLHGSSVAAPIVARMLEYMVNSDKPDSTLEATAQSGL
jgi:penicillin-binding protein 2